MKFNHSIIYYIMRKEILHIRRSRMLPLIIFAPLIQIIFFGVIVTTEVKHIPLLVVDRNNSVYSRQLTAKFANNEYFNLKKVTYDRAEIQASLTRGNITCVLSIPENFSKKIKHAQKAKVQFITDGSDSNIGNMAVSYGSIIVSDFSREIFRNKMKQFEIIIGHIPEIRMEERIWFNPDLSNTNTMIPGIIGTILLIITMMVASLSLVKEKEYGNMEHLMVTPVKPYELLLGKIIPYIVIGIIDVVLITGFGLFIFNVPFQGNFFLLLGLSLIAIFVNLGVGIYLSTISSTQQQALVSAMFFMMVNMLLSGFIFPIKNMPQIIQYFTYIIPLRYYLVILRGIFLKGLTLPELMPETISLLIYTIVIFSLSLIKFRKTIT